MSIHLWFGKNLHPDIEPESLQHLLNESHPRWHFAGYTLATAIPAGDHKNRRVVESLGFRWYKTTNRIDPKNSHPHYQPAYRVEYSGRPL